MKLKWLERLSEAARDEIICSHWGHETQNPLCPSFHMLEFLPEPLLWNSSYLSLDTKYHQRVTSQHWITSALTLTKLDILSFAHPHVVQNLWLGMFFVLWRIEMRKVWIYMHKWKCGLRFWGMSCRLKRIDQNDNDFIKTWNKILVLISNLVFCQPILQYWIWILVSSFVLLITTRIPEILGCF